MTERSLAVNALCKPDPIVMDTSARMKRVRRNDTGLELEVRRALWKRGVPYRVHPKGIVGRPDIGLKGRKVAVFIDGCFWHGCPVCKDYPTTHRDFWRRKFQVNRARRRKVRRALQQAGWVIVEVWGHEVAQDIDSASNRVAQAMKRPGSITKACVNRRLVFPGKGGKP